MPTQIIFKMVQRGLTTGLQILQSVILLEKTSARAHTDLKWENGKVVRFQVYYDPTFQIKEANAMSEMSK